MESVNPEFAVFYSKHECTIPDPDPDPDPSHYPTLARGRFHFFCFVHIFCKFSQKPMNLTDSIKFLNYSKIVIKNS